MTNEILTVTEARTRIFDLTDEVSSKGVFYTLTQRGRPKVVIMPAEEFSSWVETLEVISEFPNLQRDIEAARRDFESGRCLSLGYVSGSFGKKGGKRSKKG